MQIVVRYVNTTDNLADFFTKPLPSKHFFRMRDILMNVPGAERAPELPAGLTAMRRQRGPRKGNAASRAGG